MPSDLSFKASNPPYALSLHEQKASQGCHFMPADVSVVSGIAMSYLHLCLHFIHWLQFGEVIPVSWRRDALSLVSQCHLLENNTTFQTHLQTPFSPDLLLNIGCFEGKWNHFRSPNLASSKEEISIKVVNPKFKLSLYASQQKSQTPWATRRFLAGNL